MSVKFSIPTKFYQLLVRTADPYVPQKFLPLWNHAAGPKTVFFWAPVIKYGLVIAGIGDLTRPAEQLSISQSASLFVTGCIWSRYSLVIIPKNWGLFSCNACVAGIQFIQMCRALLYEQSIKQKKVTDTKITVAEIAPKL